MRLRYIQHSMFNFRRGDVDDITCSLWPCCELAPRRADPLKEADASFSVQRFSDRRSIVHEKPCKVSRWRTRPSTPTSGYARPCADLQREGRTCGPGSDGPCFLG